LSPINKGLVHCNTQLQQTTPLLGARQQRAARRPAGADTVRSFCEGLQLACTRRFAVMRHA
jgi:hypothetical protein